MADLLAGLGTGLSKSGILTWPRRAACSLCLVTLVSSPACPRGQTAFCWAGENDPLNAIRMLFEYQSYYWERKFASFAISCWWGTQQCFTLCIRLFRSYDGTVKCWDTKKPSVPLCWTLKADNGNSVYITNVRAICQMSDGRLVSGGYFRTLKIWKYDWNCW